MAHYRASIDTTRPRAEVFAYLSDFSSTREWDPGIVAAERVGDGELGVGSEFALVADFMGRKAPITYRIAEYDPPHEILLVGENASVISRDRLTFEELVGGTRVTYDAELELKGPLRVAGPLFGLAFDRVGDRALEGLRRHLAPAFAQTLIPLSGRNLNGENRQLPYDLSTPYAALILAFHRDQQKFVDRWLAPLLTLSRARDDIGVFEVPVISSRYGPVRWMIDGGMTRGIPDAAARERTITVYTDVGRVLDNIGLQGSDTIAVLIVERTGAVIAREFGAFDEHKCARLFAGLPPRLSST